MRLRISPFSGKETPAVGIVGRRQTKIHPAMEPPVIQAYALRSGRVERVEIGKGTPLPDDLVWVDVVQPTPEERSKVEAAYGLTLPTPEEVREIEPSDRLYTEGHARFMTATILVHADAPLPSRASRLRTARLELALTA